MMWIRWTLPRLRIDQVMTVCLKYCVPLAAMFFIGALLWKLNEVPFINDIVPHQGKHLADVRESWVLEKNAVGSAPVKEATPAKEAVPAKPAHPATVPGEPIAATTGEGVKP